MELREFKWIKGNPLQQLRQPKQKRQTRLKLFPQSTSNSPPDFICGQTPQIKISVGLAFLHIQLSLVG